MRRQQGVGVLLLILVLLAGAGSVSFWVTVSAVPFGAEEVRLNSARQGLLAARQALLAYATGYAQLYGDTGAGPGHFPCPDSDIRKPAGTGSAVLNDGPNPPCGRGGSATGWLPRQVTIDAHRYVIQAQRFRNYRYTVATGFINNPINRIVNSQVRTGLSVPGRQDVVAVLSAESADDNKKVRVFVYRKQLIDVTQRAVAVWLLEALQRVYLKSCRGNPMDEPAVVKPVDCRLTSDTSTWNSPLRHEQYLDLHGQDLLFVLTDPADSTIGRTPVRRHWFVRNQWYDEFELRIHRDCLAEQFGRCQFVIGSRVQTDSESVGNEQSDQVQLTQVQGAVTSLDMTENSRTLHRMQRIDWRPAKTGDGE